MYSLHRTFECFEIGNKELMTKIRQTSRMLYSYVRFNESLILARLFQFWRKFPEKSRALCVNHHEWLVPNENFVGVLGLRSRR